MQRVTLCGPEMEDIPDGPNIKLVMPPRDGSAPVWPMRGDNGKPALPPGHSMPITRTYSVRRLDREAGELDVDFVMHGDGAASSWAENARPGDVIGIGGPGGLDVRPADWYLFAGDHTALPAISRILEKLPADAKGEVLIHIPGASEQQDLRRPSGMSLTWLHETDIKAGRALSLDKAVRALAWPTSGTIFAWLSAESSLVRSMKAYVRDERGLTRREFLAIGYWRAGMSEPEYHEKFDHDRGEEFHATVREEDERLGRHAH